MQEAKRDINNSYKKVILNNFLGGAAWGFGVTVGLSILLAILSLIIRKISLIPIAGNFVSGVADFVLQKNPHLLK